MAPLYVALVHHPVLNRKGEIISSAVTNLDLHDLARSARTYEIPACFIVTPLKDQQVLVGRLLSHWCEGIGKELHPDRGEALKRLQVVESIASARREIEARCGETPGVWATSARKCDGSLSHARARKVLSESSVPYLLLLGTGWGLTASVLRDADGVLDPIGGVNGYNHLSVRCAASILMDRLLHEER